MSYCKGLRPASYRSLAVLVSIVFLSESVVASPGRTIAQIAQQPSTTSPAQDANRAAAQQAIAEAEKLLKQGTVEAQRQAIAKYEQALKIWRDVGDAREEASTLLGIGTVYYLQSDNQKALDYFNQGLVIRRQLKDRAGEAIMLMSVANAYSNLGEKQKAIDSYNQALQLFRAEGQRSFEPNILQAIGNAYSDLGETQKALDSYNQALEIQRAENNRTGQAETLTTLGRVYAKLGETQKALDCLNQALALQRAENNLTGQADTLTIVGTLYNFLGEPQKALESLNQALELQRTAERNNSGANPQLSRNQQGIILSSIASTYGILGEREKAIAAYNQAQELLRTAGNPGILAEVLNQISLFYNNLGEKQKALDTLKAALEIQRQIKNPKAEAFTLASIAEIYQSLGEPQKAIDAFKQALELQRKVSDRSGEAATLSKIAQVYSSLGEYQLTVDTYNQALDLSRAVSDRTQEAQTLDNIASTYRLADDYPKALEYYNQALELRRLQKNYFAEISTLTGIVRVYESLKDYPKALDAANQILSISRQNKSQFGEGAAFAMMTRVYLASGEHQKALDSSTQALSLMRQVGNPMAEANVLYNLGRTYDGLKQPQKAIETYNSVLSLRQQLGDRSGVAETLYNVARTERDRNNLDAARTQIEQAIAIVEDIRTKVASQDLRTSYFASVQKYYEFYIDLLMQQHKQQPSKGYDALALQASERARARSLLELLTEARADIRQGVNPKLLEQERTLQQQLDVREKRRQELLSSNPTEAQVTALEKEIEALLGQYREVQAQIRATSPRYAALTQPKPLTLAEIQQQVLDDNTLLLEYSLGEEGSYLWAVTKTGITSYELPKRATIEAAAKRFRETLTASTQRNNRSRVAQAATVLSQMILEPAAAQLGQKRLLIVSDGALQYVPFAALTVPKSLSKDSISEPLIVTNEIVSLPSASTLAVLRKELKGRKPASKTLAVLADPVFSSNDERFQGTGKQGNLQEQQLARSARESGVTFDRLPFTRQEADRILSLVPPAQRMQSLDFAANRATATNSELSQYQIVHLATHGILNSKNPELSGVILSLFDEQGTPQNGFLRLHDIFNLNLPAELVVLSACQTGLGKEVKGEGLMGLTRGFMYAGAPRVLVSLWNVDDEGTSELMTRFYKKMLQDGQKPTAALRAAQIEMWQEKQWQSPYYWSAFTLQGEWK
jgi:CHAT domain-containing protein/Tfp pilus assembly protein PilF